MRNPIPVLQDWCNPSERERAARNISSRFPVLCSPVRQPAGGLEGNRWGFCSTGRTSSSGLPHSTSHTHCQHFSKVNDSILISQAASNIQPRMILQSLVKSADKNLDGAMDWKEFEGFGDFDLVITRWPKMWRLLRYDLLAGIGNTCDGEEERCFPAPWTTEDLKRCLKAFISHIWLGGSSEKNRYFLGIFPKMGGGVTPIPKTFGKLPRHFWHAKFILRC